MTLEFTASIANFRAGFDITAGMRATVTKRSGNKGDLLKTADGVVVVVPKGLVSDMVRRGAARFV